MIIEGKAQAHNLVFTTSWLFSVLPYEACEITKLTDVETEDVIEAGKPRRSSWYVLITKTRYVHIISTTFGDQLEHLTETERIGFIVDLFRVSRGRSVDQSTYQQETSHADDESTTRYRGLGVDGRHVVSNLGER